jgi:hypothetical protein
MGLLYFISAKYYQCYQLKNPGRKRPLRRPRSILADNINIDNEIEEREWI